MDAQRRRLLLGMVTLPLSAGLVGCAGSSRFVPVSRHGFLPYEVPTPQGPHRFYIYRPTHHETSTRWPVILYLHGGGERGDDGVAPTQVGLGPVVQGALGYFPFVVVFPQCARKGFWTLPPMRERALHALERAIHDFNGDPERIYVTGNSMGGYGTWILAAKNPGRFAALAPVCGGVKPPRVVPIPKEARVADPTGDVYAQVARRIGPTPSWIFHGERDWLVPPDESRRMAKAMQEVSAPVRLTIWPGVGHAAEEPTYGSPDLFEWFLRQRLGQPSPDAGSPPT